MVEVTTDASRRHPGVVTHGASGDDPWRLRWGAIFGGAFVAIGLWVLMYVFGLAVGLVSANGETGQFNLPGVFIGIWAAISPLVALFVGGYVAARTAGAQDKMSGAIHGAVLWGLTTVMGIFMVWTLVSAIISGLAGLGQAAAGAAGQAVPQVQVGQMLEPVNKILQERGSPPLSQQELQTALQDVANRAIREGEVNSGMIEQALTANTKLQQQDVQAIASELEQQVKQTVKEAQDAAAKVAEQAGRGMWGLFFALLLGLISAVVGAVVGTSKRQRVLAAEKQY